MHDARDSQISRLRAKLVSLESLREELGDETVDAKKREVSARLNPLIETGGGALVHGDVDTGGGDFTGRDRYQANARGGVVIRGDAKHLVLFTGDGNQ